MKIAVAFFIVKVIFCNEKLTCYVAVFAEEFLNLARNSRRSPVSEIFEENAVRKTLYLW